MPNGCDFLEGLFHHLSLLSFLKFLQGTAWEVSGEFHFCNTTAQTPVLEQALPTWCPPAVLDSSAHLAGDGGSFAPKQ